eukprot:TRINITY_DN7429_c0_g1_i1.p2 TRINITY_DN7429_c0_g1~~TRINITY_DN7429_c0_g1_i1.p2  ORF type:complete len:59 (-),score=13.15 TRINITY_DN7429_c0_g1_i1:358-510(-)
MCNFTSQRLAEKERKRNCKKREDFADHTRYHYRYSPPSIELVETTQKSAK